MLSCSSTLTSVLPVASSAYRSQVMNGVGLPLLATFTACSSSTSTTTFSHTSTTVRLRLVLPSSSTSPPSSSVERGDEGQDADSLTGTGISLMSCCLCLTGVWGRDDDDDEDGAQEAARYFLGRGVGILDGEERGEAMGTSCCCSREQTVLVDEEWLLQAGLALEVRPGRWDGGVRLGGTRGLW